MGFVMGFDKSNLIGFVIRKDNSSNNSLFLNCKMGLSDGAFFMEITPFRAPFAQWELADTLEQEQMDRANMWWA